MAAVLQHFGAAGLLASFVGHMGRGDGGTWRHGVAADVGIDQAHEMCIRDRGYGVL